MGQESLTAGMDVALMEKAQELLSMVGRFGTIPDPPNPDINTYNPATLKKTVSSMEKFLQTATPDLTVSLSRLYLNLATWHKMEIQITNTGKAHAFFVTLGFSNDFETRRIKPITVEAGSTQVVEIGILPKTQGNIPIEVTLHYKDGNNRDYTKTSEFWIDVQPQSSTPHMFNPEEDMQQSPKPTATPRTSQPPPMSQGPVTMRSLPPEMTEKYANSEFIGKGGFARVFKAKRKDGLYVAVKVPIDLDESTGKSFIAEMQNWTKFNHPNIVKIYDYNIMPFPYFEEELCDSSLDKIKKPMDSAKAAWIIFNVCEGLKYSHSRKIIHRDLKPQNILLKNGIPKISDWGLSKIVNDVSSVTTASFTPFYAAPEQVTNKTKDQRTDIWQVGVILYELVTGLLPFTGDSMIEIIASIPTKVPVPPGDLNPEAKKIEEIILRCIEKDPAKRYQSVTVLQKDLAAFLKIDYTESLRLSTGAKNLRQSAEYCGKLLLANLKSGDLHEAYKYATDLVNYSEGEIRDQVKELSAQIKIRLDNDMNEVPDEIIETADLIAHKIGVGLTTL
jgi:serine/threonine protein kinase